MRVRVERLTNNSLKYDVAIKKTLSVLEFLCSGAQSICEYKHGEQTLNFFVKTPDKDTLRIVTKLLKREDVGFSYSKVKCGFKLEINYDQNLLSKLDEVLAIKSFSVPSFGMD